jgi:hypothetical protein
MGKYVNIDKIKFSGDSYKDFTNDTLIRLGDVRLAISQIPAEDTVEIVKCKDCKYLMFSDFYGECSRACLGIVSPDDFCSRGERKNDK